MDEKRYQEHLSNLWEKRKNCDYEVGQRIYVNLIKQLQDEYKSGMI